MYGWHTVIISSQHSQARNLRPNEINRHWYLSWRLEYLWFLVFDTQIFIIITGLSISRLIYHDYVILIQPVMILPVFHPTCTGSLNRLQRRSCTSRRLYHRRIYHQTGFEGTFYLMSLTYSAFLSFMFNYQYLKHIRT